MAGSFSVSNNFTAGNRAVADDVDTNFTDIENCLNDFPSDGAEIGTDAISSATQLADEVVTIAKIADAAKLLSTELGAGNIISSPAETDFLSSKAVDTHLSGSICQTVFKAGRVQATTTEDIPSDGTTPQNDEGEEWITQAFTPKHSDSTLLIEANITIKGDTANRKVCTPLFVDSDADAIAIAVVHVGDYEPGDEMAAFLSYSASAASTTARTYKLRFGPDGSGTITINPSGSYGDGLYGCGMKISEIRA